MHGTKQCFKTLKLWFGYGDYFVTWGSLLSNLLIKPIFMQWEIARSKLTNYSFGGVVVSCFKRETVKSASLENLKQPSSPRRKSRQSHATREEERIDRKEERVLTISSSLQHQVPLRESPRFPALLLREQGFRSPLPLLKTCAIKYLIIAVPYTLSEF